MPIAATDIEYRLSGGASNTDPDAALGGAMSTVGGGEITTAVLNNLFDDVTGDEASSGDTEYRCLYIKNAHGTLTWSTVKLWIQTVTPSSDSSVELALAGEGKNGTAEVIADESTPPVGETFSAPTSKATGLSLGDLDAGDYYPVWIKRIISAAASAYNSDGPTLRTEGDTPA